MTVAATRAVGLAQALLGSATLLRPVATVQAVTRGRGDVPDLRVVRILGARQVVQGAVTIARPRRDVALGGAAVDALHALSLVPVIAGSPRYRAAALASALLAAAAAQAGRRAGRGRAP